MIASQDLRVAMTLEQFWHRVPGGTAVAAYEMTRSLTRQGVPVVGVAARHSEPIPAQWSDVGIEIQHLPLPRPLLYETWHRFRWPRVERATGPVKVIHATTMAIPPKSAPLVVTIHDLAWLANPDHVTERGLKFFRKGFELAKRDADLIHCPSKATLDAVAAEGVSRDRLRLVPLGVSVARATSEDVARVQAKYELGSPYVMWTGTIEPRKNLSRLIEAFRGLDREIDLVLVGPKGWNEDLDRLVAGIEGRVKVLGFVPEEDLGPLYAGAEVFCYPSLLEGFGFPVLEAMAQDTPVVTSAGTSTEELAGDAAVVVDPLDTDAIAAGIASVLDDEARTAKLVSAGQARVSEFTWERTGKLLVEAYSEVAG